MTKEKNSFWEYPLFQRLALLTLQALGVGEFTPQWEFPVFFTWRIYIPIATSIISFLSGLFAFSESNSFLWPFYELETLFTHSGLDYLVRLIFLVLFWIPIAVLLFIFYLCLIGHEYFLNAYGLIGYHGVPAEGFVTTRKEWIIYYLGIYSVGFITASFFFPQSIETFTWPLLWLNYIEFIPNIPLLIFGFILLGSFYIPVFFILFIIPIWLLKELFRFYLHPDRSTHDTSSVTEDSYILNMKRIAITIEVILNLLSLILLISGALGLELFSLPNLVTIFIGSIGFIISFTLAKHTTK